MSENKRVNFVIFVLYFVDISPQVYFSLTLLTHFQKKKNFIKGKAVGYGYIVI